MDQKPLFRKDLKYSREEQQGVVFYRLEDAATQTSFRLYEIEFLIAQKFDGKNSLDEVITAVKTEFNFDISRPDIERFVGQLESMGFIEKRAEAGLEPELTPVDLTDSPDAVALTSGDGPTSIVRTPTGTGGVSDEEKKLITNALLHVKQGYIAHARDYFMAAKDLNPQNEQLAILINHLEILGDEPAAAEVNYIWQQVKEIYPEIAEQIGPPADADATSAESAGERRKSHVEGEVSARSGRRVTLLVVLVLLALAGTAAYLFLPDLLAKPPKVRTGEVVAWVDPLYYPDTAGKAVPVNRAEVAFTATGTVAEVRVKKGDKVQKGDILAIQKMSAKEQKKFTPALAAVTVANEATAKIKDQILKLDESLESLKEKKDGLMADLQKLTEDKKADPNARKTVKAALAKVSKELATAQKQRAKLDGTYKTAKSKQAQAAAKLAQLMNDAKYKKYMAVAPIDGLIGTVSFAPGKPVKAGESGLMVFDPTVVAVAFFAPNDPNVTLAEGMGAFIVVENDGRKRSITGTVDKVEGTGGTKVKVIIKIVDPDGGIYKSPDKDIHLGIPGTPKVYSVPTSALVRDKPDANRAKLLVVKDGRIALRAAVIYLAREKDALVGGDLDGTEKIITERVDEGNLGELAEGTVVEEK